MSSNQAADGRNEKCEEVKTSPPWVELACRHVAALKFGTVQITVHESRVTQIELVEKLRLDLKK